MLERFPVLKEAFQDAIDVWKSEPGFLFFFYGGLGVWVHVNFPHIVMWELAWHSVWIFILTIFFYSYRRLFR